MARYLATRLFDQPCCASNFSSGVPSSGEVLPIDRSASVALIHFVPISAATDAVGAFRLVGVDFFLGNWVQCFLRGSENIPFVLLVTPVPVRFSTLTKEETKQKTKVNKRRNQTKEETKQPPRLSTHSKPATIVPAFRPFPRNSLPNSIPYRYQLPAEKRVGPSGYGGRTNTWKLSVLYM